MGYPRAEIGGTRDGGVVGGLRGLPLLLPLLGAGCDASPGPAEAPDQAPSDATSVDCDAAPRVTWANWGEGFFRNYCTACHSSQNATARFGAPPAVNLDAEAAVLTMAARIRVRVLEQHDMPSGGGIPA